MPYPIETKDGIVIDNIPDDMFEIPAGVEVMEFPVPGG